ncbi:MAG: hypothetical protein WAM79_23385 [Candidatus Sulfotelmatobacter sp.]
MKTMTEAKDGIAKDVDNNSWRHFPQFEKLLSGEAPSPLLIGLEKTCRQIDKILKTGSEAERVSANAVMTAFGRSLDLLRALTEMRDKSVARK